MRRLAKLDWMILDGIRNRLSCRFLDTVMPKISMLGNGGVIWLLSAAVLLFFDAKLGMRIFCGLGLGALLCNLIMKPLIRRMRPCWLNDEVMPIITTPTDFSFPSGHTLSSAIAATVLALAVPLYGWIAVPIAALIAFSRLYLYVHFPSDILSASLIGSAIGVVVCHIPLLA
ncbi:MAG: phosphatase PAP2 family protein [Clostridia bacterium]|nr:phosphatase PAP2 family protein [Clostridia bacterium]